MNGMTLSLTPEMGLALAAGFVLGALVTLALVRRRSVSGMTATGVDTRDLDEARARVAELTTQSRVLETERGHLTAQLEDRLGLLEKSRTSEETLRGRVLVLERELSEARTSLSKESEAHEEKVRELSDLRAGIEERLKNLANDLLKENTEGFLKRAKEFFEGHSKSSKESVETLVKPIGEALKTYQEKLGEMEQARKRDEGEIVQQLRQVAETHLRLKDTTTTLVNALRSAPKTRGRWGSSNCAPCSKWRA